VTTTLTINSIAPIVTLAVAGGSTSVPAGAARYLAATAMDDGAIAKVEFYLDGVLLGTVSSPASGSVYSLAFTAPTAMGTHQLVARAYDNAGNSTASGVTTIEVSTPVGSAPTVGLGTPVSGAFLPAGVATTITGTVADSDGTISSVVVFMNGVSLGNASVTAGNWTLPWTPTVQGAVSLSAIDDRHR
jgi:chitinase